MLPFLSRLAWIRYLRRNTLPFEELRSFRKLSPAQQKADLARRLHNQLRYFGQRADALPEWSEAAQIQDPDELWKTWHSLPVITKETLRSRFPAQEIQSRFSIPGKVMSTGGSTGEPTHFYHDTRMVLACTTSDIYTRVLMGWKPGMPTVILWGSERDIGRAVPPKLRRMHEFLNEDLIDGYNLGEGTVDRIKQAFRRHREVAMFGFTSMLEFAARKFIEKGIAVRTGQVKVAWNGGEMLFPQQNELFQTAFGANIRNRYGGREMGAMACQAEEHGPMEVLRPWVFLEIVNSEGKPASPGEPGRVVCTSTVCRGTPFLRYEIEDSGVFEAPDQNESGLKSITRIEGRIAGILKLPDGRDINCIFWNHLFKEFREIEQFQVILRRNGQLRILFKGVGLSPDRDATLRGSLDGFLKSVPYTIEWVADIPRTTRGKLVQVVRE